MRRGVSREVGNDQLRLCRGAAKISRMTVDLDVLRKTTEELLCGRRVFDVDALAG